DAVGIDGAGAGARLPFRALAEAVRAERARVEMRLAAVAAAPEEEPAFRGGIEVGLDLGIDKRGRDRTHSRTVFSGHSRYSLSRISVALPWRDDSTPPMPCTSASSRFGTCTSGCASPRSWRTASMIFVMPPRLAGWLLQRPPPSVLNASFPTPEIRL